MGIIGVSGRMQSGKDTVAAIIQYLIWKYKVEKGQSTSIHLTFDDFKRTSVGVNTTGWEIRKFADKLKDITCMLLGCTKEQLEDRNFKEKELGEEWWYYKGRNGSLIPYTYYSKRSDEDLIKPTPRFLMQLLGTECGRQILHPNVWVNTLMNEYTPVDDAPIYLGDKTIDDGLIYPNWIISDTRFPNELKAIKDRGGITIRIIRPDFVENTLTGEKFPVKVYKQEHESETALDNYKFDYEIQNDGTIAELIDKVEVILKQEKII